MLSSVLPSRLLPAALLLALASALPAQTPPAPKAPLSTHEVHPDGSVTFRLDRPAATAVSLQLDALAKPLPMTRSEVGVWSVTTAALPPEDYGYSFTVDGTNTLDPMNGNVRPNFQALTNNVLVPATPPAPWELTAVPHGRVTRTVFTTHIAKNMPLDQDAYVVYTPPGYDAHRKPGYPVLFLLHGYTDNETGWTAVGHAQLILDNLIATGRAVPMIVVMPLGYGDLDFVLKGFAQWSTPALVDANTGLYARTLLTEISPAVDRDYNTAPGRENRAIAGLSMGGLESLTIGLNHADQFAWVAGLSAALKNRPLDRLLPTDGKGANLRLLWVACGTAEPLLPSNRDFIALAKTRGYNVTAIETPGAHTWLTWRDNLVHLAPLLFRK